MKNLLFLLMCLLTCGYSASAQDDNYSFKEAFEVTEPAQLVISSEDGDIEIIASTHKGVEVYYIVKRNNKLLKTSRAEIDKEAILKATSTPNSLNITIRYPKELRVRSANNHITVSLKIYVPKQTACNLKTSDGNISINGLIANQVLKTSDGDVHVSNIDGGVRGSTSDGNIRIKAIKGNVDFKTSDGNISLEDISGNASMSTSDGDMKASKIHGDLFLKTSDGRIEFDATDGSVTAITSDGNINGNVTTLKKMSLETSDGDIRVTIPDRLGLNLNIRGSSVNTSLKNFSGESGKHLIKGQLNGGGVPIDIRASGGNVNLIYR